MNIKPFAALVGAGLLAGCGLSGPANTTAPAPGTDAVVEMTTSLQFQPAALTIPAGSTVEFRNGSLLHHTVSGNPATAEFPSDVQLPPGAAPFEADLEAGAIYRHTFTTPGTYRYYCDPHHGLGMKGTITVTAG